MKRYRTFRVEADGLVRVFRVEEPLFDDDVIRDGTIVRWLDGIGAVSARIEEVRLKTI